MNWYLNFLAKQDQTPGGSCNAEMCRVGFQTTIFDKTFPISAPVAGTATANCKRFASPADLPENFGFLGPAYRGTSLKWKKNKIGISFSLWDANGDKLVILASSGLRDHENRNPH